MHHSLFIHSPTEGHLGCFQVWAIMNKTAVNIHVQVSVWTICVFLLEKSQSFFSKPMHTDFDHSLTVPKLPQSLPKGFHINVHCIEAI